MKTPKPVLILLGVWILAVILLILLGSCSTPRFSDKMLHQDCAKITTRVEWKGVVDTTIIRYLCDTTDKYVRTIKKFQADAR